MHFSTFNYDPTSPFMETLLLDVTLTVFAFVWWLSDQDYDCPDWRVECNVRQSVAYFKRHFSLFQGVLTTLYSIGVAGLLYLTCALGEATIWPILHEHEYTMSQLDTYLKATRGSLVSQPLALRAAKSYSARLVVVCVFLSAALHPLASTFMGAALAKQNVLVPHAKSQIKTGAGIGLVFEQQDPGPAPLPDAVMSAFGYMSSWANNFSAEPLPEFRDYVVDRTSLVKIGNMSATAVQINKTINCQPRLVTPGQAEDDSGSMYVVNITHNDTNIDQTVHVRFQPMMTTWVDGVQEFEGNENRKGGATFSSDNLTEQITFYPFTISAIACDIDIELVDSQFQTGQSNTAEGKLQSVTELKFPNHGSRASLCTWLGAATTLFGVSVYGAQPMFYNSDQGIKFWTTTEFDRATDWTQADIERFIDASAGAVAMSMPGFTHNVTAPIESQYSPTQLNHRRSYLLLLPIAGIVVATAILAILNSDIHRQQGIPRMRLATVGDILQSSVTESIQEAAVRDGIDPSEPTKLGGMSVRYGVCKGGVVGLGDPDVVSRFRD